jgi:hypothetical protein
MSAHLLLEAAVRTLVMGAIIMVALRALRIEQVRARRTAWLLALLGALAMPALVGAHIGPRLLPELSVARMPIGTAQFVQRPAVLIGPEEPQSGSEATPSSPRQTLVDTRSEERGRANPALSLALMGYCAVAAVLTLRLCAGVGFAFRLRNQSERITLTFDPGLDVRSSGRLATPVTIGRSVLLPLSFTSWDEATLRVVLSHERAHVRQGDFYVHALAGLHCALFWFNPFSWWLQRQLSELGEALSDCAAVDQAESRTSYAEILLAFATRARSPGVAMASAGNLTSRIERLLSDRGFERSFAGKQRLPFIAAGVVMLALVASTSMERVRAAPAIEIRTAAASTSVAGVAALSAAAASAPVTRAPSASAPAAAVVHNDTPAAPNDAQAAHNDTQAADSDAQAAHNDTPAAPQTAQKPKKPSVNHANGATLEHEAGGDTPDEGVMVIQSDHSNFSFDSGNLLPKQPGNYIYFQHDGKPYLIQDPEIIAKAQTLLAPMKELHEQQRMLGHQQALLGAQQRMLAAQQRAFKAVDTPEFKREMAELEKTIKDMKVPDIDVKIDQQALAQIQAHLGEIQARVGHLQAELGMQFSQFGTQFGQFGEQQGKLGEQQAQLGEQQRKLVEEVRRQLKPLIEQAIREGKGRALVD